MPSDHLANMTSDELLALNQQEMADRAKAEEASKARSAAINAALDTQRVSEALERDLAGLTPDVREAVLANMGKGG